MMPDTLFGGWVASHSRQGCNAGQWLHRLMAGVGLLTSSHMPLVSPEHKAVSNRGTPASAPASSCHGFTRRPRVPTTK